MSLDSDEEMGMMKQFFITLAVVTSLLWVLVPSEVHAHGSVPNVQKYCEQVFKYKKNSLAGKVDKIDYFYSKKERQWYCRKTFPHFQKGVDHFYRKFDPSDACAATRGTKLVHYHKGIDVTSTNSMHCGIVDGTVSSKEGQKTKLALCNKSNQSTIYAAYAYWVPAAYNVKKGWSMTGWWEIKQGQCRNVQVSNRTYDANIYLYAEGGGTVWGGPEAKFCVHKTDAFTIEQADVAQCSNSNYMRVPTSKFHVSPGNNTYNFL